jgi:hypothetical protein
MTSTNQPQDTANGTVASNPADENTQLITVTDSKSYILQN